MKLNYSSSSAEIFSAAKVKTEGEKQFSKKLGYINE